MEKLEIILEGKDAKRCAELINDLAYQTMKHYDVEPVNVYCGHAPVKKGISELLPPMFINK